MDAILLPAVPLQMSVSLVCPSVACSPNPSRSRPSDSSCETEKVKDMNVKVGSQKLLILYQEELVKLVCKYMLSASNEAVEREAKSLVVLREEEQSYA